MGSSYRNITGNEKEALLSHGCTGDNWNGLFVKDPFNVDRISSVHFSGTNYLGCFDSDTLMDGCIKRPTGIFNATLHNCTIGDNVYIRNVGNYIANYRIGERVIIENVNLIATDGKTSFGNGLEITVLNESGGRGIPMYDFLSAHTAYMLACYRHRPNLVQRLNTMIAEYALKVTAEYGIIEQGTKILNTGIIRNVRIGEHTVIEGADRLENGSINSCNSDPVYIGPSVTAEDFIINSGSKLSDGSLIFRCFIGQSCTLTKQYSAENSLFFANCGGYHGEASCIFAAPFTVTHHKSTLLIAGFFSFLNAGSGSNQSNHMYKLGPVHHGIIERGSKTTSDSYVLWPAKIGAFTLIAGRHVRNADTSNLPFSYLIENNNESILSPGVNLRSVGTIRDAKKWPERDHRKTENKLDYINFNILSPYTAQKMVQGINILQTLLKTSGATSDYYTYNSVKIKKSSLTRGIELYELAIDKFLGNCLIKRLQNHKFSTESQMQALLTPQSGHGKGEWVDLAGLFVPASAIQEILDNIENSSIPDLSSLQEVYREFYNHYDEYAWTYASDIIERRLKKPISTITAKDVISMITEWKNSVITLDRMYIDDARKEFNLNAQISFGIDGDMQTRQTDFENVRGTFDTNQFVLEIFEHIQAKTALAEEMISRIKKHGE